REPVTLWQLRRGPVEGLERYAGDHPDSRPAALALGRAYLRAGRAGDAVRQLGAWVQRMPADPDARILLARGLLGEHRSAEAYAQLQVANGLSPADPEVHWWL